MAQKKGNKNGQNAQAGETERYLEQIIKRARKQKSVQPILDVIKDTRLSKTTRQKLAVKYMETLQHLTTKVFFRATLKKFSRAIDAVLEILKEQKFMETHKYIQRKWSQWMEKELWETLEKNGIDVSIHYARLQKKQQQQKTEDTEKTPSEVEILKQYI